METHEFEAGPDQLIVVYVVPNTGEGIDVAAIWKAAAEDASARAAKGWRIVSTAVTPMRQMGTAGNILFQSGGQFVTQAAVAIVYARR